MSARLGIKMGTLTTPQLTAAKALVQAMTGTPMGEGYNEVEGLWAADDYLSANGGGTNYGAGNFYIAFFGTPSMTGTFEIQMTGHHRTVSNTYINGILVGATPSFVATEPYASFTSGGITYQPLLEEKTALVAMLAGLTTSQATAAHLKYHLYGYSVRTSKRLDVPYNQTRSASQCIDGSAKAINFRCHCDLCK